MIHIGTNDFTNGFSTMKDVKWVRQTDKDQAVLFQVLSIDLTGTLNKR